MREKVISTIVIKWLYNIISLFAIDLDILDQFVKQKLVYTMSLKFWW